MTQPMSIAIEQDIDTADVLAPEQPRDARGDRAVGATRVASLIVKTLHGGEASGMDLADRVACRTASSSRCSSICASRCSCR